MKRVSFILLILLLISGRVFSLDILRLEPLNSNDFLRLSYEDDEGVLLIKRVNNGKEYIYYTCDCSWGAWEISEDKRKILIYENGRHDIYFLDGNTGIIQFKGTINQASFASSDFKYLITSKIVPEDRMINFVIIDLDSMEELYNFPWLAQRKIFSEYGWMTFKYYRSLDQNFDFSIYAVVEGGVSTGHALLNATTREFEVQEDYHEDRVPKKTYYECGWE